jgi:hypothetical protein
MAQKPHPTAQDVFDLIERLPYHEMKIVYDYLRLKFFQPVTIAAVEQGLGLLLPKVAEAAEAHFKRQRDAKPRNAERDAEIVRLRDSDKKLWSWAKLGRKFGIDKDAARAAYKEHKRRNGRC